MLRFIRIQRREASVVLKLCYRLDQLQFSQLMKVYSQSSLHNSSSQHPYRCILQAEQEMYAFLSEVFFRTKGAFLGIWQVDDQYVSALRMEPYKDGLLLEALETAPEARNNGYATMLLHAVLTHLAAQGPVKVYSHVDKHNGASMAVHTACGFGILKEYAHYIDGSISQNAYTLCYALQ